MRTIEEWTAYYHQLKLWIYPCSLKEKPLLFWKKVKTDEDYTAISKEWDWCDCRGIQLVVGKKGVRVLEVTTERLLKKALHLLGLPKDYSWIIYSKSRYGIVMDTPGISPLSKGMSNKSFKKISLLWEGYYVLPSINIPRYFYMNRTPIEHPQQVRDDVLITTVNQLF